MEMDAKRMAETRKEKIAIIRKILAQRPDDDGAQVEWESRLKRAQDRYWAEFERCDGNAGVSDWQITVTRGEGTPDWETFDWLYAHSEEKAAQIAMLLERAYELAGCKGRRVSFEKVFGL